MNYETYENLTKYYSSKNNDYNYMPFIMVTQIFFWSSYNCRLIIPYVQRKVKKNWYYGNFIKSCLKCLTIEIIWLKFKQTLRKYFKLISYLFSFNCTKRDTYLKICNLIGFSITFYFYIVYYTIITITVV